MAMTAVLVVVFVLLALMSRLRWCPGQMLMVLTLLLLRWVVERASARAKGPRPLVMGGASKWIEKGPIGGGTEEARGIPGEGELSLSSVSCVPEPVGRGPWGHE